MGAKGTSKTGGRKKGSPNKRTLELKERAAELGMDPFDILCLYANRKWEELGYTGPTRKMLSKSGETVEVDTIGPDQAIAAAKAACEYLHPKRKAVEVTGANGGPLSFTQLIEQFTESNAGE